MFWISGKKEWDNVTSLMKLRDINFAARNEVKSYDGPFLSRDFLEYIKNITTVFLISFSTISYSFIFQEIDCHTFDYIIFHVYEKFIFLKF